MQQTNGALGLYTRPQCLTFEYNHRLQAINLFLTFLKSHKQYCQQTVVAMYK